MEARAPALLPHGTVDIFMEPLDMSMLATDHDMSLPVLVSQCVCSYTFIYVYVIHVYNLYNIYIYIHAHTYLYI